MAKEERERLDRFANDLVCALEHTAILISEEMKTASSHCNNEKKTLAGTIHLYTTHIHTHIHKHTHTRTHTHTQHNTTHKTHTHTQHTSRITHTTLPIQRRMRGIAKSQMT